MWGPLPHSRWSLQQKVQLLIGQPQASSAGAHGCPPRFQEGVHHFPTPSGSHPTIYCLRVSGCHVYSPPLHVPQSAPPCLCRVCVCWRGMSPCRGERMPPFQFCCWPLASALSSGSCVPPTPPHLEDPPSQHGPLPAPNIKLVRGCGESRA